MDTDSLRRKTVMLRESVAQELGAIESGRRRQNGSFRIFCEPIARGVLTEVSGAAYTGPEASANILVGLINLFEGYLSMIDSHPELAGRLRPHMHEVAALIHANVLAVSAPLPKIVRVAMSGKRRRRT